MLSNVLSISNGQTGCKNNNKIEIKKKKRRTQFLCLLLSSGSEKRRNKFG